MKYITPMLEIERLVLKQGTYEDYAKVYEYDFSYLKNIDGINKYIKQDLNEIKEFVDYADKTEYCLDFIVYLKNNMEPIANICLDRYDSNLKSLELTINEHPNYWKNGYMKEALLEIINYVFNSLDIDNIIYSYVENNINSKNLCDNLGFKYIDKYTSHFNRIDKDVVMIKTIISKDKISG